jgi:hypothetical protein
MEQVKEDKNGLLKKVEDLMYNKYGREFVVNPFLEEVYDIVEYEWMTEKEYEEACMDI